MAAEVLREFLVGLGFKIEPSSEKKFQDAITSATLKANLLADAFVGVAKTIAENIGKAVGDLENLYFTSIRVGSSATNLKALTQASQDFGVSAAESLGNIEALAQALKTDPGKEAFVKSLGVQTRDANLQLRDTVDIANDLGKVLATKPDYLAQQLADLIGLTYRFQTMIKDPGWLGDLEKQKQLLEHGGYDQAALQAKELEQQLRLLGTRWDAIKTQLEGAIFGKQGENLDSLNKWLDAHGPEIEAAVHDIAVAFEILGRVLAKAAEGWHLIFQEAKQFGDYINNAFPNFSEKLGKGFGWLIDKLGFKDIVDQELGLASASSSTPKTSGTSRGIRLNNPGNLTYAGQPGASREGGAPGERDEAAFPSPAAGLLAMANQLELYSSRGLNNLTALLTRYAPPGENDTGAYIQDVAGQMHVGSSQSLNLHDPTVLSNLMNAMIHHENAGNPYRPQDVRSAAEGAIGAAHITLNNNPTININGAKDPSQTKQAVTDALADSYRKMTRNLQPTTQ
jgi:hypothetical protein